MNKIKEKKKGGRPPIGSRELTKEMIEKYSHLLDDTSRMIALTQGKVTIVDASDYEWLNQWLWYAAEQSQRPGVFYAQRVFRVAGKMCTVHMQRMVINPDLDAAKKAIGLVDHKDHDTLNNRRSNLRMTDYFGNNQNRTKHKIGSSKYKGVTHRGPKPHGREWRARLGFKGKMFRIGDFYTEVDAARAHDKLAAELQKDFACLNFPSEVPAPICAPSQAR